MKFLSELASCCGGAVVTPAAEGATGEWLTEEPEKYCHDYGQMTVAKVKPRRRNWKPKLNAISEDSPMEEPDKGDHSQRLVGANKKKRPVIVKPKSTAIHDYEGFWKSTITLPVFFPPTPYLF